MKTLRQLLNMFEENPSIPGIKNDQDLNAVLKFGSRVVFVLYGNVLSVKTTIQKLKNAGNTVFVNTDLIEGFSSKDVVVDYLRQNTALDGILSSKAGMIRAAREFNLLAIHRFFIIDSFSFGNIGKQIDISKPDCIEMMPGCMPKVLSWVKEATNKPVIAGGLVCDEEDAQAALKAGAVAVSSTNRAVWNLSLTKINSNILDSLPKRRILKTVYPTS